MNDTELAYMAGVLDSDGSISIIHSVKLNQHRAGGQEYQRRFQFQIGICQTSDAAISLFSEFCGNNSFYLSDEAYRRTLDNQRKQGFNVHPERRRLIIRWTVRGWKAYRLLKALLPYMKVKRQQAELAIKFQELKHVQQQEWRKAGSIKGRQGKLPYPAEYWAAQAALREELQKLNDSRTHQSLLFTMRGLKAG